MATKTMIKEGGDESQEFVSSEGKKSHRLSAFAKERMRRVTSGEVALIKNVH
jgi:hypothetical protein